MKITAFVLTAVLSTGLFEIAAAEDIVLVQAETLLTGKGQVLSPGSVLIKDGKIVEVGTGLLADGAQVVDVKFLIPGLVDAAARTGISRLDNEQTKEITPDLVSSAIVDWTDKEFSEHTASGTTCIHLTPGTSNVIAGMTSAVKTSGVADGRIVAAKTGLAISVCSDPASGNRSRSRPDSIYVRQPTNRMGVVWMLRNAFHSTRTGKFDSPAMKLAAAGEMPIFAVSRTHYDIQSLLSLADEFSFHPTLVGGQEAWKLTEELAQRKIAVVLQRQTPGSTRGDERTRISGNMAARLNTAGVAFCLSGGDLLDQMRFAVRFGLPAEAALATVTSSPAAILKIDDRVGSIEAGKDADMVGLNGDPLGFSTAIQWVMVDGAIQFEQAGN